MSPWYKKISDDEKFPQSLQESAQQIIISFAKWYGQLFCVYIFFSENATNECCLLISVKDTDWVQFFTIQLVEDFASHFRLFREAQHKLCENKKKGM